MKRFKNLFGTMFIIFAVLTFYGSTVNLQANYLKKAYSSVKKKAKKLIHKGKAYTKKGKKILYKGKVIGKNVGRSYILIGKRLYKTTKNTSKSIFKIGKTLYTFEAKGLIFIGKSIFYSGFLIGNVLGNGLVKVDGIVYQAIKGAKASKARAEDLVLNGVVYRKKGSKHRVRNRALPDVIVSRIYLDKNCNVMVKVKNAGKGAVPIAVWKKHKPNSSSIYIKRYGKNWGGSTIWKFDKSQRLLKPGGSTMYKSNLKVKGTQKITAIIDKRRV
ncbi:MAG: hypothetical protein L3J44_05710, partial [Campylobacteraceae bacterium]|nr:hypothetical protein [Campylobacteraceae bacterium]